MAVEYRAEVDEAFTQRKHYGRYFHVAEWLKQESDVAGTACTIHDVEKEISSFVIHPTSLVGGDDGGGSARQWHVDAVALCTGVIPSGNYEEFVDCAHYSHDYCSHADTIVTLRGDETVVVIGTRLIAIDIVAELERRGHRGNIVMGGFKF